MWLLKTCLRGSTDTVLRFTKATDWTLSAASSCKCLHCRTLVYSLQARLCILPVCRQSREAVDIDKQATVSHHHAKTAFRYGASFALVEHECCVAFD
jgi:hypothetical protein